MFRLRTSWCLCYASLPIATRAVTAASHRPSSVIKPPDIWTCWPVPLFLHPLLCLGFQAWPMILSCFLLSLHSSSCHTYFSLWSSCSLVVDIDLSFRQFLDHLQTSHHSATNSYFSFLPQYSMLSMASFIIIFLNYFRWTEVVTKGILVLRLVPQYMAVIPPTLPQQLLLLPLDLYLIIWSILLPHQ